MISGTRRLAHVPDIIVCSEHKEQIDKGAIWDVHDFGKVLIGQDMPPTLRTWSVRDSVGVEGFTLRLETSSENPKPFDVFITPAHAMELHSILESRRGA